MIRALYAVIFVMGFVAAGAFLHFVGDANDYQRREEIERVR
ncbi:hypothetical protein [Bradyrhizobium icense]|nr:hypothetical protein [Bradyrhizobium icense]